MDLPSLPPGYNTALALEVYKMSCRRIRDIMEGSFLLVTIIAGGEGGGGGRSGVGLLWSGDRWRRRGWRLPLTRYIAPLAAVVAARPPSLTCADITNENMCRKTGRRNPVQRRGGG